MHFGLLKIVPNECPIKHLHLGPFLKNISDWHYVKNSRNQSLFWSVFSRICTEYVKMRTRKLQIQAVYVGGGTFHTVVCMRSSRNVSEQLINKTFVVGWFGISHITKSRVKPRKQPLEDDLQNRCSYKRCNIHRKTHVLKSLFNKVTGLQTCNFIRKRLQHRCIPANISKFLIIASFIAHLWWLFIKPSRLIHSW